VGAQVAEVQLRLRKDTDALRSCVNTAGGGVAQETGLSGGCWGLFWQGGGGLESKCRVGQGNSNPALVQQLHCGRGGGAGENGERGRPQALPLPWLMFEGGAWVRPI
jgi:hypothetical protein